MTIGTQSSATALIQRVQMTCTVQLHCPINAQIRPVDNQSHSRILLLIVLINVENDRRSDVHALRLSLQKIFKTFDRI